MEPGVGLSRRPTAYKAARLRPHLPPPANTSRGRRPSGRTSLTKRHRFDSTWLASAGYDRTVRIWDPATGTCRHTLTGHTDSVPSPAGDAVAEIGSERLQLLARAVVGAVVAVSVVAVPIGMLPVVVVVVDVVVEIAVVDIAVVDIVLGDVAVGFVGGLGDEVGVEPFLCG